MRLSDALAALSPGAFERACQRHQLTIDPSLRRSPIDQAARQLAALVRGDYLARLPRAAREAAELLARSPEGVDRKALGGGTVAVLEHNLAFNLPGDPQRIVMPVELRAALPVATGEDPTSARALLVDAPEETLSALGAQLRGRRTIEPAATIAAALLDRLESPPLLRKEIADLSPTQSALLAAIEARGGQLETDEVLALERSPIRYADGSGAFPSRSAAHALMIHGLLLPRGRGVWVLPTEVAQIVSGPRREIAHRERQRLIEKALGDDDAQPARARFGMDPAPKVLALLAWLEAEGGLVRSDRAVRRSLLRRSATLHGIDPRQAELLVAVARAAGARLSRSELSGAGAVLFQVWRESSAWDEARVEADAQRAGDEIARVATPTAALRTALIDLLADVPGPRFAPTAAIASAAAADLHTTGAVRSLDRARKRAPDRFAADPAAILRTILQESLFALGALDLAADGELVRLSSRARRWLAGGSTVAERSTWEGPRLQVRNGRVDTILEAGGAASPIYADGVLVLSVDAASLARALAHEVDAARVLSTIASRFQTK